MLSPEQPALATVPRLSPAVLGWFDGISLQLVPPGPAVFADGFEDR